MSDDVRRPASGAPRGIPGPRPGGFGPGAHLGMAAPTSKPRDFAGAVRRLASLLGPHRFTIALVVVLAIASVAFSVTGPRIIGRATNIIFEGVVGKQLPAGMAKDQVVAGLRASGRDTLADMLEAMDVEPGRGIDFERLGSTAVLIAAIYLAAALLSWGQGYLMAGVSQRVVYDLRRQVDEKLSRLPLAYFDANPRGDILSRVTNDIDNIAQTLSQSLTQIITAVLTIVGILGMMLWISPLLAAIALVTVPLSIVVAVSIAKRSQGYFAEQWKQTGELNSHVEEMHTGHPIVKVFGRQREAIEEFDRRNERMYEASFKAQFISGLIQPSMNLINNLNYVAVCVVGGVRVATGALTLGDVQAFIQYARQFQQPITQTASIANVLQSTVASAERVFELIDEREETPDPAEPVRLERVEGHVRFEEVSFRYLPEVPLIEDVCLEARPGETVAIVGPTGAGKTTLVNLLMRFYDVDAGVISIDGVDIRAMRRDDLRRIFGMVLQDTWLFGGTIRENIAYGREGATEAEIIAAAQAAHVDHVVRTLPDGYDTRLDDEAANISAGERQLLTIARAFLADPSVLILDEATSSVDTRTELLIQRAMKRLMHGRTSFVIAHRLSTIRNADLILVMNQGRIIEQGTHGELMEKRGFYHDLYQSQFTAAYDEAV